MYSQELLDHFQHPRNAGDLDSPNAIAEVSNPICGDVLRLSLQVADGKIIAAGFRAQGCVPAVACGSALTELLSGASIENARLLGAEHLERALGGLPQTGRHAAELALDALDAALKNFDKGR